MESRTVINIADHDGCITSYGLYSDHEAAASALRQKGWSEFSTIGGEWTHQPGAGDRTHATIKNLHKFEIQIQPPDKLP